MNINAMLKNAAVINETAKRLNAVAGRAETKQKRITEAREELAELQQEAHEATTAMTEGTGGEHRELSDIAKDIQKAHNKIDRAIDAARDDMEWAQDAATKLYELVNGQMATASVEKAA